MISLRELCCMNEEELDRFIADTQHKMREMVSEREAKLAEANALSYALLTLHNRRACLEMERAQGLHTRP